MSLLRQAAKAAFATTDLLLPTPKGPRILIYHQVGRGTGQQMDVSLEDFRWQMDWLAQNRELVDLDTAIERWDEPASENLVVLTFDDGYIDTFTTAFPLLIERGFPFTLYLSTKMIESGEEGALGWGQIQAMCDSGLLTIGSHTHTHLDLRTAELREIRAEISEADALIERRLGLAPTHFAYPWGYWTLAAHRIVTERYQTAVLGAPRKPTITDFHRIYRFPIQLGDGKLWFRARLHGGLMVEELVRRRLRGYRGP